LIIGRRYRGPDESGNGGYTAGLVAGYVAGPAAEVTLRVPPPLDTPLSVRPEKDGVEVYEGTTLVATARPVTVTDGVVPPVDFDLATEVSKDYPGFMAHPFPRCFVCGPERAAGDGMRLFPGRLPDGRTATPWTVPDEIAPPLVWAALDCPGGWSVGIEARPYVLGRLAVHLDTLPAPDSRCVIMGATIGIQGRKADVAATLYGPDGDILTRSRATWIALPT